MGSEWILDVLTDLKAYASKNGMSVLAEQLDDARLVAAAEIATHAASQPALRGRVDGASVGEAYRAS